MRFGTSVAVLLAAAAAALGCGAGEYAFQPTVPSRARVEALNSPRTGADVIYAARYPVPQADPRGGVRVASFGPAHVEAASRCGASSSTGATPALLVRLTVRNGTDERPWTLDTRTLRLAAPGQPDRGPLFVNANDGALPVVTIARAERRTVDVYFPLPPEAATSFDVTWRIQTGAVLTEGRTSFHREPLHDQHAGLTGEVDGPNTFWDTYRGTFAPGAGSTWWLDPAARRGACAPAEAAATQALWPRVTLAVTPR